MGDMKGVALTSLGGHPTQRDTRDSGFVLCGVFTCGGDSLGPWGRFGDVRLRAITSSSIPGVVAKSRGRW